ncbi:unnamed protein product [Owenia fusiformis]|uniref:Uncharacterized protein n=1 Tax=Owenia fusiformis TaxID=6347 RepID=A0A8S4NLC3_OWEFU|nr:unnamed protein product [Owenia fusiformis]
MNNTEQPHLDEMVGYQSQKEDYDSYDGDLNGSQADPINNIRSIPDSQQDNKTHTLTNGRPKTKGRTNTNTSRITPYQISKKPTNIMDTLGLKSRRTPNKLPTAKADRIVLENLRKATH